MTTTKQSEKHLSTAQQRGRYPVNGSADTQRLTPCKPCFLHQYLADDAEAWVEQERQHYLHAAVLPWPSDRRNCGDYTTLAERVADREGEAARLRALNREMRRQYRADNPPHPGLAWPLALIVSAVALCALVVAAVQ